MTASPGARPAGTPTVRVAELQADCRTLGPGVRFVVWVQGCPLTCPDCVSPQWIPFAGGRDVPVDELAARIAAEAVDGVTLSGGEPFAHAAALVRLVDEVRARRDLSVLAFSGYTVERLRERGDADQQALLDRLDILVDGPYVRSRHADLLWRGSDNQRIHLLGDRHRPADLPPDRPGAGLQFEVGDDGGVRWSGVPPVPGFRRNFELATGLVGPNDPRERQP